MKCSYHPAVESQQVCSACSRALCNECVHRVKEKPYCQECLVRGAEWAATVKDLRLPSDSPKRAAICAIIPGMGAVYNNEYMKAVTYFAVWAALLMMGDRMHGVFGFAAFAFLIFTIFDAYRSAEDQARRRIERRLPTVERNEDRTAIGWGVLLIVLGAIFLLHNFIPYYVLNQLWPVVFIGLGVFLVYRALHKRESRIDDPVSRGNT